MVTRRQTLALCCMITALIFVPGLAHSEDPTPIEATLSIHSGNNTVGSGPASFSLHLISLDEGTYQIDILWTLEAQNGTLVHFNDTDSTVSGVATVVFWNHSALSEGLWTAHAAIFPNSSNAWIINLSANLIHLRPAEIIVLPSATWDVSWNEADGSKMNVTPSSGDDLDVLIRVENLGDVTVNLTWVLGAKHEGIEISNASGSTTIAGGERALVGPLSISQAPEGVIILGLVANTTEQGNISISVDLGVGPPPLPALDVYFDNDEEALTLQIWNNGTAPGEVNITCTHGASTIIDAQIIALPTDVLTEITVASEPSDGTYTCTATSPTRIHENSVVIAQMTFNRSGPIWSLLSEPIAVEGPRHVSDLFELRVPIENAGDAEGNVTLQLVHNGTIFTGDTILVAAGSSEVLSSSVFLFVAGTLTLEWQVLDIDSGSVSNQGSIEVSVLPPQTVNLVSAEISSASATSHGLSAIIELSLGTSRTVEVEVTSEGIVRHHSEQQIHPGNQTVHISVPQVDSDRQLLLIVRQAGWGSNIVHSLMLNVDISYPIAQIAVMGGWPEQALPGDILTIQTEIANTGPISLDEGIVRATRATDGFLLAEQTTPTIAVDDSVMVTLEFKEWPSGPGGTVVWEYHSGNGASSEHQMILSLPRQNIVSSKSLSEDIDFRDVKVGAALGAIGIALIAIGRAVVRSQSFAGRIHGEETEKDGGGESTAEREVQCPSCDQRLTVPSTYRGRARCTRCGEVFSAAPSEPPLEGVEEKGTDSDTVAGPANEVEESYSEAATESNKGASEKIPESSSLTDVIECPSCSQPLRVPLERRPTKARCPACSATFTANRE